MYVQRYELQFIFLGFVKLIFIRHALRGEVVTDVTEMRASSVNIEDLTARLTGT